MSKKSKFKPILFLLLIGIATIVYLNNKEEQSLNKKRTSENIFSKNGKNGWLSKLDQSSQDFVKIIDSINLIDPALKSDFYNLNINIDKGTEKNWREATSESYSWINNEYDKETGRILKSQKISGHIKKSYLLSVRKDEVWSNLSNGKKEFLIYIFQYGVLLNPDTLGSRIFPAGTFVAIPFTQYSAIKQAKYKVEYFSNYEKFLTFIYQEMRSARYFKSQMDEFFFGNITIHF